MKIYADFSLFWIIPIFLISFFVCFLYYRRQKQIEGISKALKMLLISLRASGITLCFVLLLGILFESNISKNQKPIFINLIDSSSSMLNYADSALVEDQIKEYQQLLVQSSNDKYDFVNLYLNESGFSDTMGFSGNLTDLDFGFNSIFENYYNQNVGGICLISDGNYNQGVNPVYSAARIPFTPVYTLMVGDTIQKKDILIRAVNFNKITFYKNQFPIEVIVDSYLSPSQKLKVDLFKDGKLIASKPVLFDDSEYSSVMTNFLVDANTIGFSEYRVQVESVTGEYSFENNSQSFYIETIDSRSKLLLLAEAPHPDVAVLKKVITNNQNLELETVLINDFKGDLNDYQLVVMHGGSSTRFFDLVKNVKNLKKSLWMILTNDADRSKVVNSGFSMSYPRANTLDDVQPQLNAGFELFELSDEFKENYKLWPPIKVPFGDIKQRDGIELFTQRIGGIQKDDALMFFKEIYGQKSSVFIGEGLWKWRMINFVQTKGTAEFDEFVRKSIQYLTVKENKSPLQLSFPDHFLSNRNVDITAEFYNSSLEAITIPEVIFTYTNTEKEEKKLSFSKMKNQYLLLS